MCNIQLHLALLFVALAVVCSAEFDILPAGQCLQDKFKPMLLDFDKLAGYGRWNIIYTTDTEAFRDVDHAYHELHIVHSNIYVINTTRVFKDKSQSVYTFTLTYDKGTFTEEASDDNGNIILFHDYDLLLTPEKSTMYYRCTDADSGVGEVDTRYIIVPASRTLSQSDEKQFLEADSKLKFKGKLIKLPREFV